MNKSGFSNNLMNDLIGLGHCEEFDQKQKNSLISLFSLAKRASSKIPGDHDVLSIAVTDKNGEIMVDLES
mgnify:CR=1 FL=1